MEDILGALSSDNLLNFNQWLGNSIPIFTETHLPVCILLVRHESIINYGLNT